jgi:hypothetical protein
MPGWDPPSHTFTFTQDSKGVVQTYSWGNSANPHGWNRNQAEDLVAAFDAIDKGYAQHVADSSLDKYVDKAYDELNKPQNEHVNCWVFGNCKTEKTKLIDEAERLREIDRKKCPPKK